MKKTGTLNFFPNQLTWLTDKPQVQMYFTSPSWSGALKECNRPSFGPSGDGKRGDRSLVTVGVGGTAESTGLSDIIALGKVGKTLTKFKRETEQTVLLIWLDILVKKRENKLPIRIIYYYQYK